MKTLRRRVLIILLEAIAACVLLLTLGTGFAVWQLYRGPVEANFALEYIEPFLNPPGAELSFDVGAVTLQLSGDERELIVTARDVAANAVGGETVFSAPVMEARYNFQRLVSAGYEEGLAAFREKGLTPRLVVLKGPSIRLIRSMEGPVRIAATLPPADPEPASEETVIDVSVIDQFLAGGGASQGLEGLIIDEATLTLDDLPSDVRWIAENARVRLSRTEAGIGLTGDLDLLLGESTVPLSGDAVWIKSTKRLDVDMSVGTVLPAALAAKLPEFEMLKALAAPVSGSMRATLSTDLTPRDAEAQLDIGAGGLSLPAFYANPLAIFGGTLSGTWSRGAGAVVTASNLDLGGPLADATLTLRREDGGDTDLLAVDLAAVVSGLPVDVLAEYWPERLAGNARRWVDLNLSAGTVDRADLALSGVLSLETGKFDDVALEGEGRFRDVTVRYIDGMPPVEGVDGRVRYSDIAVTIDTVNGSIPGMALDLKQAHIDLVDLVAGIPRAEIEISVVGPVRDALRLIDNDPLNYPEKLGLDPSMVSGQAATKLALDFPLVNSLRLDEIGVGAASNITGAVLRDLPFGKGITDGDLTLSLDGLGMTIDGKAKISGGPVTFRWAERFAEADSRRVEGRVTVTGATLDDLGVEIAPYGAGAAEVGFDYRELPGGRATIGLDGDLTNTQMRLPILDWEKPPGAPASLTAMLLLRDGIPIGVRDIALSAPSLDGSGSVSFDPETGEPVLLALDRFVLGRTDLTAEADLTGSPWRVTVRGRQIDAGAFLMQEDDGLPESGVADDEDGFAPERPLELDIAVDRLLLDEARVLDGFSARLDHSGERWGRMRLEGRPNGQGRLTFEALPLPQGHNFLVNATDAGATLRWLGLVSSVEGGILTVDGTVDMDAPETALDARMRVDRFRVVRAPAVLQVLRLVSLTGLFEALSRDGIPFVRFDGSLKKEGQEIVIENGRGVGRSLGFQIEGQLSDEADQLDLKGLLVPAYTINNTIGAIPLVGQLLTGGEGGGVIATRFYVTGTAEDPDVVVDPLQSLAPGFLRNVFGYFIDGAGAQDRNTILGDPTEEGPDR
ncbi:MAG: hypothetical protein NXI16_04995 [Alphaproteobacteria bacterium]|nr:hypothetical protein [Alphaproteobacteria bacterium]